MEKIREALFYTSLSEKRMILNDLVRYRIRKSKESDRTDDGLIEDDMLLNDFELLFNKKIVVCCADDSGRMADEYIRNLKGAQIYAFCEKYPDHWRKINGSDTFLDKPVISLSECERLSQNGDVLVILATNAAKKEEYVRTINNDHKGICPIVTWIGFFAAVFFNIEDKRFNDRFREDFKWENRIRTEDAMWHFYSGCMETMVKDDLFMAYSPPKTGTTSIYRSLKERKLNTVHIHHISGYEKTSLGYFDLVKDFFSYWKDTIPDKKSIKVIALVRDPIARSISQAFQMIEMDHIKKTDHGRNIMEDVYKNLTDDMAAGDGYMFEWFRNEFGRTFGVDIYSHDFDKEKGYMLVEKDNIRILVMTLEKLNSNAGVIGQFCDIPDFRLKRSNDGQSKIYNNLYRSTLKKTVVPKEIIDFYYNDNGSMRFFYGDDDIERFRKKWDR